MALDYRFYLIFITLIVFQTATWRTTNHSQNTHNHFQKICDYRCVGLFHWQGLTGIKVYACNYIHHFVGCNYSSTPIHYDDVIMTTIASQITSLMVVYSTVYSDADQSKHQSSASLVFVWGIHRDRWIPRTKGQLRGKCIHLMTSSCSMALKWMGNYTPPFYVNVITYPSSNLSSGFANLC